MDLTRNQLKLMAVLLMVIDHTGLFLMGNHFICREIGRLSFPLYLFLLLDGFRHTRDIGRFARRLLFWYAVSIVPYSLAFYGTLFSRTQNIYLTMYVCLCLFCVLGNKERSVLCRFIGVMCIALTGELLHMEYGWYAVAMAVVFYYFENSAMVFRKLFAASALYGIVTGQMLQLFAALSAALLPPDGVLPESRRPDKMTQILLYAFYPMHLLFFAFLLT